jgi:hypothetical protein
MIIAFSSQSRFYSDLFILSVRQYKLYMNIRYGKFAEVSPRFEAIFRFETLGM